jgi:hypothetical protein
MLIRGSKKNNTKMYFPSYKQNNNKVKSLLLIIFFILFIAIQSWICFSRFSSEFKIKFISWCLRLITRKGKENHFSRISQWHVSHKQYRCLFVTGDDCTVKTSYSEARFPATKDNQQQTSSKRFRRRRTNFFFCTDVYENVMIHC